jgi:hypothetical protein
MKPLRMAGLTRDVPVAELDVVLIATGAVLCTVALPRDIDMDEEGPELALLTMTANDVDIKVDSSEVVLRVPSSYPDFFQFGR